MNLVSCDYCGVVLDLDKIPVPSTFDRALGFHTSKAGVLNAKSTIECPVCNVTLYIKKERIDGHVKDHSNEGEADGS